MKDVAVEGKIALEEHFSTEMNNALWDAAGEEARNGATYARHIERRLVDSEACLREMDRAGIEMCIMSLTSPGVQGVADPKSALALARDANDYAPRLCQAHPDQRTGCRSVRVRTQSANDPRVLPMPAETAVTIPVPLNKLF